MTNNNEKRNAAVKLAMALILMVTPVMAQTAVAKNEDEAETVRRIVVSIPDRKLVLIENPGHGGSLNHLGVEVESTEKVDAEQRRLAEAGLATVDSRGSTCCYARQGKVWVEPQQPGARVCLSVPIEAV